MYETNEYVTVQQGGVHRRPSQRIWLALIPTVAALVALLLVLGAACRSRSADEDASLGAVTATPSPSVEASPSPSPSPGPSEPAEEPGTGTGGGNPAPGGGGSSGGGSSSGGGGTSGGSEEPQPLEIGATLTTPPAVGGCTAAGRVTTTGGGPEEYPLTLTYRWFWMPITEPPSQMPPPVQFGGDTDIHFTGPAEVSVASPTFPEDEDAVKHRVLLEVSGGGEEVDSGWKVYGCGVEIAQTQ